MTDALITEDLTYPAETTMVPARLYRLPRDGRRPGILLCPGRLRNIDGLAFLSEALAAAGYVVLATTYRGMDFFSDDQDARAGLDYLAGRPDVDAGRLGLVGHSRGGMTGLRTAAQEARVRSLAALAPPTEFPSYVRAMALLAPARYEVMIRSMGGTPEEQPGRYRQISALNYAADIRCPVLLVCGTQDLHAPFDHSQWMHDALVAAGNQRVRLHALEGVGHFFERMYFGYLFEEVARLVVDWFDETLAGPDHG